MTLHLKVIRSDGFTLKYFILGEGSVIVNIYSFDLKFQLFIDGV